MLTRWNSLSWPLDFSPRLVYGYEAGGIAGFFDAFHQVVGLEPDGGGSVVGVDADDAAVFGKLFVRVEVDGVFGVV